MHRADAAGWRKGGSLSFAGGANAAFPASSIAADQYAKGVNCQCRGGRLKPRPAYFRKRLSFATVNGTQPDLAGFKGGKFQHASFYVDSQHPALISSHSGVLYKIDLHTFQVTNITPGAGNADINFPDHDMGWSAQCEHFWIYQDNLDKAIIYNGASSRRADASQYEVPTGNVMCYAQGRLAVALPDRHTFRIGDLLFGDGTYESVLRFTENNFLNEGGDFVARVFGAPSNLGNITSMVAAAMPDTSLGQGPLLVGTPFSVFTVQLPYDRTTWKNLSYPIQTVVPMNGPLGQDSTILVNTDVWYRAIDGIRSYISARREMGTSWGNSPMSAEVWDTLAYDTESLLEYGSSVHFDNRIIHTISPVKTDHGVYHRGLVSIDLTGVSTIRSKTAPAWDGVWTGLQVLKILKGLVDKTERCFIYALSGDDEIELWELMPDEKFDNGSDLIYWSAELPSYDCQDGDKLKRLETGRIVLENVTGQLVGTVRYRSDENPCWNGWDTFSVCAANEDCTVYDDCTGPLTLRPQSRVPVKLKMPPDDFNTVGEKRLVRTGYQFQPRIELGGYGEIVQFRLFAKDQPEMLAPNDRDFT